MSIPCEVVDSTQLQIGDVVHCQGGRFELVSCYASAEQGRIEAERLRTFAKSYRITET